MYNHALSESDKRVWEKSRKQDMCDITKSSNLFLRFTLDSLKWNLMHLLFWIVEISCSYSSKGSFIGYHQVSLCHHLIKNSSKWFSTETVNSKSVQKNTQTFSLICIFNFTLFINNDTLLWLSLSRINTMQSQKLTWNKITIRYSILHSMSQLSAKVIINAR